MTAMTLAPPRAPVPQQARPKRRPLVLALGFGVAAAAISFIGSWIPSLWGDEVTSVLSAERPLPSLFRMLGHVDAVHGTYYLFLHFWVAVFGAAPISVRFPSAIATGVAVAGVTALAYRMAGFRTAVFAGAICVVIPRITYMGQEARGYAFSAALATWVTYLLVELVLRQSNKRRYWVLYAVGVAACAYVFLFSLLLVPAHLVLVLWTRDRALLLRWVRALIAGLVLALPILVYGIAERGQISFLTDRTAATFASVMVGQWFGNTLCAIVCWSLLAAALIFAAVRWRRGSRRIAEPLGSSGVPLGDRALPLIATVWLLFPPAVLLLINFVDPIYSSRYLTFATPAFALLVGHFLAQVRPRWIAPVLAVAVAATALPTYEAQRTPYAENASDWATDAAYIGAHASRGDAILFDETINPSKRPRLAMRAYPSDFVGLKDVALKTPWWQTDNWDDAIYPLADVSSRLSGIRTVWLIEYRAAGGKPDTYDLPTLAQLGYQRVHTTQEHSSIIMEFQRS
jgi:mannosyltransferase